jgi:tetratricopeptide (TPR) repeat protein
VSSGIALPPPGRGAPPPAPLQRKEFCFLPLSRELGERWERGPGGEVNGIIKDLPDHNATSPPPPLSGANVPHGLEVLRTYGDGFAGRAWELSELHRAWNEGAVRVFVLHAQGGAGKTRVIAKWLTELRDAGWRGAERVFVHSFYSQGSDERRNASSELFFEKALAYFCHPGPPLTDPTEKGRTLARLLVEHHGLLVLDGLEPLQHPPSFDQGRLKDPAIYSLLLALAAGRLGDASGSGLCVVTSRQRVVELQNKTGRTVLQEPLDRLDAAAGAELLRQFQIVGPEEDLKKASDEFRGHAYSLMLLGSYLKAATDHHDIRRRREVVLLDEDPEHGEHARHMFTAYVEHLGENSPEVAVLRLLGFFDRAAELQLLDVLRKREGVVYEWSKEAKESDRRSQSQRIEDTLAEVTAPLLDLPQAQWNRVLNRLRELRLLDLIETGKSPALEAHPLLRECFAEQVRTQFPAAWQAGHRRLFEHLSGTAPYRPEGIEGLQPLYQAVAHGCLAGLYEQVCVDVYRDRIQRGSGADGFYSMRKLGAIGADLGAVTCFFEKPWATVKPSLAPISQAWLLNQAAIRLRALGRLTEAVEPMAAGLASAIEHERWKNAAIRASNLSELALSLGELAKAVRVGEQSVKYADQSGDAAEQIINRTTLADALHQAGRYAESRRLFADTESQQAARSPNHPWLFSLRGFRYCDLLLADAERAAWQRCLLRETGLSKISTGPNAVCAAVRERASYALRLERETGQLLDTSLDHLILARAALYESHSPSDHLLAAIEGLRAASRADYLPRGLLTRAWMRHLSGDEPGSRVDLDEAWEIAERGPMPLFQADIHLTRARLFRDRVALAEARRLIEKHGYHRRDGELADAEAAARTWPHPPSPSPIAHPAPGRGGAATQSTDTVQQSEDSMSDQVFISYSHRDKKFMEELQTHLKPYLRSGAITPWSDKQIAPGLQWFAEIQGRLNKAGVAVLLVSPDFLASDFIHEHELGPLLKEAKAGGVRILWVPLRPSAYKETPLKDYQAVSAPDEPLAQMNKAHRDEAWVKICQEIKRAVNP